MPPGAVAFNADHHRKSEQVVVDVHHHRQSLRTRGGEDPLGAGDVAKAGEHDCGGAGLGDLGFGQQPGGPGAGEALVRPEGRFLDHPHRRGSGRAASRQALDEGDGLGGAQLVGEDQQTHRRLGGECVAVGRGLAREIGCRHGIFGPFAGAV